MRTGACICDTIAAVLISVDVQPDALDIAGVVTSGLASLAALVAVGVAIYDARSARAEAKRERQALKDEREERVAERAQNEALSIAQLQAVHFKLSGAWFQQNERTVFVVEIKNESDRWITDIDVFVSHPITLRPGAPPGLEATSVFSAPAHLSANDTGDASFPDATVDRDYPRDPALPPLLEAMFTDYLGNRWFRDTEGRLILTKKAGGLCEYDPGMYLDPDWRTN